MINDGERSGEEGYFVELAPGKQQVTIDLGAPHEMYAILFWHFHKTPRVYFDVIVQVADDAAFTKNVRTIFNNDHDNTSGMGAGKDHELRRDVGREAGGRARASSPVTSGCTARATTPTS